MEGRRLGNSGGGERKSWHHHQHRAPLYSKRQVGTCSCVPGMRLVMCSSLPVCIATLPVSGCVAVASLEFMYANVLKNEETQNVSGHLRKRHSCQRWVTCGYVVCALSRPALCGCSEHLCPLALSSEAAKKDYVCRTNESAEGAVKTCVKTPMRLHAMLVIYRGRLLACHALDWGTMPERSKHATFYSYNN